MSGDLVIQLGQEALMMVMIICIIQDRLLILKNTYLINYLKSLLKFRRKILRKPQSTIFALKMELIQKNLVKTF